MLFSPTIMRFVPAGSSIYHPEPAALQAPIVTGGMISGQDQAQIETVFCGTFGHRLPIFRVNFVAGIPTAGGQPDIIVGNGRNGCDFDDRHFANNLVLVPYGARERGFYQLYKSSDLSHVNSSKA